MNLTPVLDFVGRVFDQPIVIVVAVCVGAILIVGAVLDMLTRRPAVPPVYHYPPALAAAEQHPIAASPAAAAAISGEVLARRSTAQEVVDTLAAELAALTGEPWAELTRLERAAVDEMQAEIESMDRPGQVRGMLVSYVDPVEVVEVSWNRDVPAVAGHTDPADPDPDEVDPDPAWEDDNALDEDDPDVAWPPDTFVAPHTDVAVAEVWSLPAEQRAAATAEWLGEIRATPAFDAPARVRPALTFEEQILAEADEVLDRALCHLDAVMADVYDRLGVTEVEAAPLRFDLDAMAYVPVGVR